MRIAQYILATSLTSSVSNIPLFLFIVPNGYPQNFMGTTPTSRTAVLTWDPPPDEEQNGVVINYVINVTEAKSGVNFQLSSTNTSLFVNTLQPFTTYNFLIAAATSVGVGPFSRLFTLQTPEDGRPSLFTMFLRLVATESNLIVYSLLITLNIIYMC